MILNIDRRLSGQTYEMEGIVVRYGVHWGTPWQHVLRVQSPKTIIS